MIRHAFALCALLLPLTGCSSGEIEVVANGPDGGTTTADGSHVTAHVRDGSLSSGDDGSPGSGILCASNRRLEVFPASTSVPVGADAQFTATLNCSDGTTESVTTMAAWSSSDTAVATVGSATGLVTPVVPGTASITASFEGISATALVTVVATIFASPDGGTDAHAPDAEVTCVDPVVGDGCTPGVTAPCAQPANPCTAGYIWSCFPGTNTWYHELIQCSESSGGTATSACPKGELLFVNDVAGTPCLFPGDGGAADAGGCPAGLYLIEPNCCNPAATALCVPSPSECGSDVSCGCLTSFCDTQCDVGTAPEISCSNATQSVVDCLCGKA